MYKEYTTSPTVSTEILMLSCSIDKMEVYDVATSDIPQDLLQTNYGKGYIHIKMEGSMVNLLEDIDLVYFKDFIYLDIRGRKIMHKEAKKAIYSTLEASLLFWTKLLQESIKMGYKRKKYDWCVIKKFVKGKKCTILWHGKNIKVLHVNSDIVSSIFSEIDAEYGKISKMTITRGKIRKYLGVTIEYSSTGKVKLSMVD